MQAREQLNTLRDFDRADLLFALLAARQLLSLDAGCNLEEIVSDAQAMGRTENWAVTGIKRGCRKSPFLKSVGKSRSGLLKKGDEESN